ncbi:hypothetical protein QBL02_06320 [Leucobacter sp. UT-8R-CII-1-4]|uniref:hypothetical protein n=1 Tax=Leucobacter sp. UT-8R-CII-1-4 TaxID=3040075 RepID=UPI0024A7BB60|nr:hypothetical protein [Leucobacter sp. UT-8R-CII-1-4]MDI6023157.1 hypothetical protein [Leucobacter sp. UT-8R-CII-1-4]
MVDASAIASPLVEDDTIVNACAQFDWDVKKWLRSAEVIFLFGDGQLSEWASQVRSRLDYIGLKTTTPAALSEQAMWTRQLWFLHDDSGRPPHHMRADRVERIVVPWGEEPPFDVVVEKVAHYVALMSFPEDDDEPRVRTQDFDSFGIAADEEPF